LETINTRLDVVEELTSKEDLFTGLRSVLGRFLDLDHLLSMCVQVPKEETVKAADNKITTIIYLKHTLEEVEALRMSLAVGDTENTLLRQYQAVSCLHVSSRSRDFVRICDNMIILPKLPLFCIIQDGPKK
jgi:DNA mismatch repair ATPase MutS